MTLLTGDIINEIEYGQDFSPDWDGTVLEDVKPSNPGMPTTFTWYNENSSFGAGRLDYIVYSGSVLELGTSFSLHSKTLPQEFLDTTFLQRNDTYEASDHLPIVADFRNKEVTNSKVGSKKSQSFRLYQNYPNPFNPSTNIKFDIPENGLVSLIVYDLMGHKVSELVNTNMNSGFHNVSWNGTDNFGNTVSTGVYIYQLKTGNYSNTQKMLFIK